MSATTELTVSGKEKPSEELKRLAEGLEHTPLSLLVIVASCGPHGPLLIALFLALPFLLPGTIPGFGMACGAAVALLGIAVATGKLYWPATGPLSRPLGGPVVAKALGIGAALLRRAEKLTRPRLQWLVNGIAARKAIGSGVALLGVVLALPLPPGTNAPPAVGIILLALGALTRDGLMAGVGYVVAVLNLVGLAVFGFLGMAGLKWIAEFMPF